MDINKNSMVFYHDWIPILEALDKGKAIEIVLALVKFDRDGVEPDLDFENQLERAVFNNMLDSVRRNRQAYENKCEKNKKNGEKGGRPKNRTVSKKTERLSEKPNGFLHHDNDNDNDNDNDIDNGIDNDSENEKDNGYDNDFLYMRKGANEIFVPPTVGDIEVYCANKGLVVDAEAFVDFYTSKGWMVGKNKMTDWPSAVRNWARNSSGQKRGDGSWVEEMKGW